MADYVLIMAGGKGERLWPLSRADRPKQFIPLLPDGRSLFQVTFDRAIKVVGHDRAYVVTGARYVGLAREQVTGLSEDHVIVEPAGRDTGPCLALGTTFLVSRDQDCGRHAPERSGRRSHSQGGRVMTWLHRRSCTMAL